jgi:isopentenyl phosphate kinase
MFIFLKLGGSLITDKNRAYTPRPEVLDDLAAQIASSMQETPDLHLVLGHGSGSFGHQAAIQYDTRNGVTSPEGWRWFAEVWYQASALNRLVIESLHKHKLPAVTLSPVSAVMTRDGQVAKWDPMPVKTALANGLLPVIHGDVAFDQVRGGTILSTEDLFATLARNLNPQRILLAGLEEGVWLDFPACKHLIKEMTPKDLAVQTFIPGGSVATDVTGGMGAKVREMIKLVEQLPELEVLIFSGLKPGNISCALHGENPGTRLHY